MSMTLPNTLNAPEFLGHDDVKIWLDQQIWGHRFHNDQTPWLMLLEAIGLMAFRAHDQNTEQIFAPPGNEHENLRYELQAARQLRQIVFADRHIDEIADQQAVSDAALWNRWFDRLGPDEAPKFEYLRRRFAKFGAFRNAVALLRGSEIEPQRKRRLTSRHFAPRGPAMLSADYGEGKKSGAPNKDRRFFARGGELLFLMLNRSGRTGQLEDLVSRRLLSDRSKWNRLAEYLAPPATEAPVTFGNIGYMPLRQHRTYEILADDWVSLLSLKALPDDNLSEPLMRLSGLAVIRYMVERAAEVLGVSCPPFPIDMMGANSAGVRKLSKDAYARHRDMSRKAVEQVVQDFVASPEWRRATQEANPKAALEDLAKRRFGFEADEPVTVDGLAQRITEDALDAHNGHLGLVMGFYAEQIGLAPRRQGGGRWYVLSDALLEALVLANVRQPAEFEIFLDKLYTKYGFVLGTEAADRAYKSANYHQQVKANQRHLEERLRVLGLVKRLSDDCAFVINPFWAEEAAA